MTFTTVSSLLISFAPDAKRPRVEMTVRISMKARIFLFICFSFVFVVNDKLNKDNILVKPI